MHKEDLKIYLIPLAFILPGVGLFALVWNVEARWISLPIGIISFLLILLGLRLASNVADAQLKEYYANQPVITGTYAYFPKPHTQMILYNCFKYFSITGIMSLSLSGHKIENYTDWVSSLLDIVIKGSAISIVCGWLYKKRYKIKLDSVEREDHIIFAFYFLPFMLFFHFAIWYNVLQHSPVQEQVVTTVVSKSSDQGGKRFVHLNFKGKSQRFVFPRKVFKKAREGDSVICVVRRGAFNYSYVEAFRLIAAR